MGKTINFQILPFRLYPAARLLGAQTTYSMAEKMYQEGCISDQEWRWYRFFWVWGAIRMSDVESASMKQHRCAKRLGYFGLQRRMQRVQLLQQALILKWFGAYMH